jgi:hypothetical protein
LLPVGVVLGGALRWLAARIGAGELVEFH